MKVTFLGTAGGTLEKDKTYPAFLINNDLILDCGEGTTQKLLQLQIIHNIDYICLSHLHNDHFMGLFSLLWYYFINRRKELLHICGPPNTKDTINTILDLSNTPDSIKTFKIKYHEFNVSDDIQSIQWDTYMIDTIKVSHAIPTLGYRIEYKGKSICYSSDTKPDESLILLANNTDLFLCESTFPEKHSSLAHQLFHSTSADAGRMAAKSNSSMLALTHIAADFFGKEEEMVKEAKKYFKGKVILAESMKSVEI